MVLKKGEMLHGGEQHRAEVWVEVDMYLTSFTKPWVQHALIQAWRDGVRCVGMWDAIVTRLLCPMGSEVRLLEQVADTIWVCDEKKITPWKGDIQSYKAHLRKQMEAQAGKMFSGTGVQ